jgi:hypothetical protein
MMRSRSRVSVIERELFWSAAVLNYRRTQVTVNFPEVGAQIQLRASGDLETHLVNYASLYMEVQLETRNPVYCTLTGRSIPSPLHVLSPSNILPATVV